jgi:hypothetical protein
MELPSRCQSTLQTEPVIGASNPTSGVIVRLTTLYVVDVATSAADSRRAARLPRRFLRDAYVQRSPDFPLPLRSVVSEKNDGSRAGRTRR